MKRRSFFGMLAALAVFPFGGRRKKDSPMLHDLWVDPSAYRKIKEWPTGKLFIGDCVSHGSNVQKESIDARLPT